jgi:hypothetical protein
MSQLLNRAPGLSHFYIEMSQLVLPTCTSLSEALDEPFMFSHIANLHLEGSHRSEKRSNLSCLNMAGISYQFSCCNMTKNQESYQVYFL